jgi:exodeoxyribonuclease V alpha subunit
MTAATKPAPPPTLLERLRRTGQLADIDAHFAALVVELASAPSETLALTAALASRASGLGHVCLDLARLAGEAQFESEWRAPEIGAWRHELLASGVVGEAGAFRPIVLDGDRLYLQRYWRYETGFAEALTRRAVQPVDRIEDSRLSAGLARLFGDADADALQRDAAEMAVRQRLAVISGGPGTGKTTTVARVLALAVENAAPASLAVGLAAPTGKAAARLRESIEGAREKLGLSPALAEALPHEAATLHRLLGMRADRARPRFDASNPLPLDILVVDEASMIDLALAAKLVAALRPEARLILLGDKDQLASVEAGAVLASLAAALPRKNVVLLEKSWRFPATSGIGRLAACVRDGDATGAEFVLEAGSGGGLGWHRSPELRLLVDEAMACYAPLFAAAETASDVEGCFAALARYRVLCAHRRGPLGALAINRAIVARLEARGVVMRGRRFYPGQPLMVTANDYSLRLFNGDVGIVVPDATMADGLAVAFPEEGGGIRRLATARIPACETVYAMTVHKSQGSEFEDVLLVLPPEPSPVLSRELVYTGVTRAKRRVALAAQPEVLRASLAARVERDSGLAARLAAAAR